MVVNSWLIFLVIPTHEYMSVVFIWL